MEKHCSAIFRNFCGHRHAISAHKRAKEKYIASMIRVVWKKKDGKE
jgi:hypothetical protein